MISAKIVKDSTSWLGIRLTTMILNYPRSIHSELMTHRVFSRNSASSRAIPYSTLKERILQDNFHPFWTYNQKGMQGKMVDEIKIIEEADKYWEEIRDIVLDKSINLSELGIHKQNINRLLEPFQYIQVLVTSTEWDNFISLRNHELAQLEIQILAKKVQEELFKSKPELLKIGQWHIPFINDHIYGASTDELALKVSVSRCARISYGKQENTRPLADDLKLYDRLVGSNPKHLSPTEHQAQVPSEEKLDMFNCYWVEKFNNGNSQYIYVQGPFHSNLTGWIQYRKFIENDIKIH